MPALTTFRRLFITAALAAMSSQGALLYDSGVTALSAADPTQLGRLSRNGIIADWSTTEPFPGVINTTTSYHFQIFDIPINVFPFIQITMDSVGANTFASAYLNTYDPINKATNYLGDTGSSGNFFGTDPIAFQVIVPVGNHLIVLVNQTGAGTVGLGDPFRILVEGFSDTDFNENVAPEPASVFLSGGGLAALLIFAFLRRKQHPGAGALPLN